MYLLFIEALKDRRVQIAIAVFVLITVVLLLVYPSIGAAWSVVGWVIGVLYATVFSVFKHRPSPTPEPIDSRPIIDIPKAVDVSMDKIHEDVKRYPADVLSEEAEKLWGDK